MADQDPIDEFIALPQDQQMTTLQKLAPDKQDALLAQVKQRKAAPVATTAAPQNSHSIWDSYDQAVAPLTQIDPHQMPHSVSDVGREGLRALSNIGAGGLGVLLHPLDTLHGLAETAAAGTDPGKLAALATPMVQSFYEHPLETGEQMVGQAGATDALTAGAGGLINKVGKTARTLAESATNTSPIQTSKLISETLEKNQAAREAAEAKNAQLAKDRQAQLQQHFEKTQQAKAATEQGQAAQSRKAALNRGVEQLDTQFQDDLKGTAKKANAEGNRRYQVVRSALSEPQSQPVEYVKNGRDVDIAATEAKLPPAQEGYARLYRSESPTDNFNDVFDKSKLGDFSKRPEGNSYTDDLNSAAYYKSSYGPNAKTSYIDVPSSVADSYHMGTGEYVVPKAPTAPPEALSQAVQRAEAKIQGSSENLKIFRDILSKHPETDPDFVDYQGAQIPKGHPLYEVLKEQGGEGAAPTTFSDLQGYYSELGDKLAGGGLQGDVYQALKSLHDDIGKTMQQMADQSGVGAELKDAQNYWRNYMQAFREPTSPLYKAIKAGERGKSIAALQGKDQTGIGVLAQYDPQLAQRANTIRGYQAEAKGITTKAPPIKPAPTLAPPKPQVQPEITQLGPEDIQAAKTKAIQTRANTARQKGGYYGLRTTLYSIPAAMTTLALGHPFAALAELATGPTVLSSSKFIADALESPAIVRRLSKPSAADLAELQKMPADQRTQLAQNLGPLIQSAAKRGIRVDPIYTGILGGAGAQMGLPKNHALAQ